MEKKKNGENGLVIRRFKLGRTQEEIEYEARITDVAKVRLKIHNDEARKANRLFLGLIVVSAILGPILYLAGLISFLGGLIAFFVALGLVALITENPVSSEEYENIILLLQSQTNIDNQEWFELEEDDDQAREAYLLNDALITKYLNGELTDKS